MGTVQHRQDIHLMLKIGMHEDAIEVIVLELPDPFGSGGMHTIAAPCPHGPVRNMEEVTGDLDAVWDGWWLNASPAPTSDIENPAVWKKPGGGIGPPALASGQESPALCRGTSQCGPALVPAFRECPLEGKCVNQFVLIRRVEQIHKAAACTASDLPWVTVIRVQPMGGAAGALADWACPEARSGFGHG